MLEGDYSKDIWSRFYTYANTWCNSSVGFLEQKISLIYLLALNQVDFQTLFQLTPFLLIRMRMGCRWWEYAYDLDPQIHTIEI